MHIYANKTEFRKPLSDSDYKIQLQWKYSFAIALIGFLAGVPSTYNLVAPLMLAVMIECRKYVVGRTSNGWGRRYFLFFLLQAFLDIFGDALASDALAPFAEVRPERTLLLFLAEWA